MPQVLAIKFGLQSAQLCLYNSKQQTECPMPLVGFLFLGLALQSQDCCGVSHLHTPIA